jgi:hypothetical protein
MAWRRLGVGTAPAAQRLFAAAGAKGAGQRYVQFEFDLAALAKEEK